MVDLHTLADAVADESSFIAFVQALAADWEDEAAKELANPSPPYGPGANGWENDTIGAFLKAAAAWARSSAANRPSCQSTENPWCRFAQILRAGKYYE